MYAVHHICGLGTLPDGNRRRRRNYHCAIGCLLKCARKRACCPTYRWFSLGLPVPCTFPAPARLQHACTANRLWMANQGAARCLPDEHLWLPPTALDSNSTWCVACRGCVLVRIAGDGGRKHHGLPCRCARTARIWCQLSVQARQADFFWEPAGRRCFLHHAARVEAHRAFVHRLRMTYLLHV